MKQDRSMESANETDGEQCVTDGGIVAVPISDSLRESCDKLKESHGFTEEELIERAVDRLLD